MAQAISDVSAGQGPGRADGRVRIKNTALKPHRPVRTGAPTKQGARPGRNDGSEWLYHPTSEHVFGNLPAEEPAPTEAPAAAGWPWWPALALAGALAVGAVVVALL